MENAPSVVNVTCPQFNTVIEESKLLNNTMSSTNNIIKILKKLGAVVVLIVIIFVMAVAVVCGNPTNRSSDTDEAIQTTLDTSQVMDLEKETERLKEKVEKDGLDAAIKEYLRENPDKWKNETIKLAVIGRSGVGKSSFINALRNVTVKDKEYANVSSAGNTTTEITGYRFPGNNNITIFDLPGFGTTQFPKKEYADRMELNTYDYLFLFVRTVEENDLDIGDILNSLGRPFCFVRSMLDIDLDNAKREGLSKDEVIGKIVKNASKALLERGFQNKLFLISSLNRRIGDFDSLLSHTENNLPKLKRESLILSVVGSLTDDMIEKKYQIIKQRLFPAALKSAGAATIPIPGLDLVLNIALLVSEIQVMRTTFGFEDRLTKRIASDAGVRKNLHERTVVLISTRQALRQLLVTELATMTSIMVAQSTLDVCLPIIGSVISGCTAGITAYLSLSRLLDRCRDDAKILHSHLLK